MSLRQTSETSIFPKESIFEGSTFKASDSLMNRRSFILRSLGATIALPKLPSLMAAAVEGNSAVQVVKGAGSGAPRFVAIGNLLGFQVKQLFPTTTGLGYEKTTLLEPLEENRQQMTVYRG